MTCVNVPVTHFEIVILWLKKLLKCKSTVVVSVFAVIKYVGFKCEWAFLNPLFLMDKSP